MPGEDRGLGLAPGRVLAGRYRIEAPLGAGGMGLVYRAADLEAGAPVALKCIAGIADSVDRRRFRRETRALQALSHPHIVPLLGHGHDEEGDILFFTMELVPAVTLEEVLEARGAVREPAELDWYLRVHLQLAGALEYLHERRFVHRDIKPANVLLRVPGLEDPMPPAQEWVEFDNVIAQLGDFGLVKSRDSQGSLTQTALGTPQYMAPEQVESSPAVDARADLYSLGVILYRMATGALPFRRLSDALSRRPAPRLREIQPELPELLEDTVARLLEFEPFRRPASASEVAQLLETVLQRKNRRAAGEIPATKMAQPAFCGRTAELLTIKKGAERAARGSGRWISIRGEQGSGKSWLVHRSDLKSHALVHNEQTFHPGAFVREQPHAAFGEIVQSLLRHLERHRGREHALRALGPWGAILAHFLPQLAIADLLADCPPLEPAPAQVQEQRFIDTVIGVLTADAEIAPRIIAIEDLHFASDLDLATLRRLLLCAVDLPVLVVTTHRPDRSAGAAAAERLRAELRELDRLDEVEMQPFTAVEARAMVESLLLPLRTADGAFVDVLLERTGGVPLYLLHLINSLWSRGAIRATDHTWIVDREQVLALPVPESTRSHFQLLLDELPAPQLRTLQHAAVVGRQVPFDILHEVSGLDEFELDGVCRDLTHAGVFEEHADGFRFTHSLEREVLLSQLTRPLRARLHRRVADAIEGLHGTEPEAHLADLAEHLYRAGDAARGLRAIERAARRAELAHALGEALDLHRKALELARERKERRRWLASAGNLAQRVGEPEAAREYSREALELFDDEARLVDGGEPVPESRVAEVRELAGLLVKIGDLHGKSGQLEPALEYYERAGRISESLGDADGIAFARVRTGAALLLGERVREAQDAYLAAVELYENRAPGPHLVSALNGLSRVASFRGDTAGALERAQRALAIADDLGDLSQCAGLASTIGTIQRRQGLYDDAVRSFERSIELHEEIGDRRGMAMAFGNLSLLHNSRGEFRKGLAECQRAHDNFQLVGDTMGVLQTIGVIATMHLQMGNYEEARTALDNYLAESRRRSVQRFVADALTTSGLLALELGENDRAERLLEEARETFEGAGYESDAESVRVYLARVYGREGRHAEAERLAGEIVARHGDAPATEAVAEALRVRAEAYLAQDDPQAAEELAQEALQIFRRLSLPHAEAVCCRTLGKIYRELGFYWADQAGKYLERAVERFDALGCRHALAISQLEYGEFLGLMEEDEQARACLEAAREVFAELGLQRELSRTERALEELT